MFVIFFGSDRRGVRDAATRYVEQNLPEGGVLETVDAFEYQPGQLADALGAASLFGGEEWFILDTPAANEEMAAAVQGALAELAASPNTFIIIEGPLSAAAKKAYAAHAAEIQEFSADKAEQFNPFAMADALAVKDRRRLWVLLQEAKLNGLREEEIVGVLWWQLKTLRLAQLTKSAAEAGIKDFPYNKARRALVKFQKGEVERLAQSLLELYHDGHAGAREIDLALEQWALQV